MYDSIKERLLALLAERNFTFLDTTRARAEAYLDKFRVFEGLTEAEVAALEEELGYAFPEDFAIYLKTFGKKGGLLFNGGVDLRPNEFASYQSMRGLLDESTASTFFKDNLFIFYHHQGYKFCAYHRDEQGQLGIYFYCEGDEAPRKVYDQFTEMMEVEIRYLEHEHAEMKRMGGYFVQLDGNSEQHGTQWVDGLPPRAADDVFLD